MDVDIFARWVVIAGSVSVEINDRIAAFPERIDEMRADEAAAAGEEDFHFRE